MASHLVGGSRREARPGSSPAPTANGSVGQLESIPFQREVPSGLARSTRATTASLELEVRVLLRAPVITRGGKVVIR